MKITLEIIERISEHSRDGLPNEACGLLTGVDDTVLRFYPMTNTDASAEHFSFDPAEQFAVLREARSEGHRIIANYHSHPATPARPSDEDIRLAFDPDIIYVIVSLAGARPDLKAFRIRNGTVAVEPVEIIP